MQPEQIQKWIEAGMPDATVHVEGDGAHFTAVVISEQFAGKSRIDKQQMVYDTVRSALEDGRIHALSLRTFTAAEWQAINDGEA